ncbi:MULTISPECIES: SusC/RagA family TonB-linked outer membrane protein [Butyricimonas]|uniref:SusC/RagA family TonB-linked outer membrane protein n=1 Tax=Butyricimonas TaxID=574697 RepID=UPI001D09783D|nr:MULTISPECIES: SusC/RagA family TonB-linked outer membrane protein [Butyricimonas]MCB6970955.1 SusC/RagA family TonB-linked outer membrane protein [Butyricimonas synergistica]MCG4517669.1 SusC/RagA family TonB-linked outer membrane protein [Butyricimonas sp. DFI.6.44]
MKKIFNVAGKRRFLFLLFLVFTTQISLNAYSQDKSLTFSLKNATLKEIINEIRKLSDYDFVYRDVNLEAFKRCDVSYKDAAIDAVLTDCLRGTGLTYEINGKTIIIRKESPKEVNQKMKTVTGKITDERGEVLPGVTIMIKGTALGTATDADGNYKLNVPAEGEQVLSFSFVGMKTREIAVADKTKIDVKMEEDSETLDDVVVTGIFTKAKESYTGAVTSVSAKELKMYKGQNLLATLRNIDPSINVVMDNALGSNPNVVPEINIRGNSSLPMSVEELNQQASKQLNAPLVIMDGFEISLQKLMDFNDEEIESINILKDASATAIYGSRGANGVIVVTTKVPQGGKLRIYAQGGINIEIPDLSSYDMLNARDKLELERIVGLYDDEEDVTRDRKLKELYNTLYSDVLRGVDTYWLSEPVRTGIGQKYNLRLEGGGDAFRWGANLSYNTIQGAMKASERNTFSGSVTLSYTLKNVIFKNQTIIDINKGVESKYGTFSDYVNMNPYYRTKDENGQYIKTYKEKGLNIPNPLYDANLNTINEKEYTTITNNFSIEWNIANALKLRAQLGLQKQTNTSDYYLPADHTEFDTYNGSDSYFRKGKYVYGTGEDMNIDGNATLSYSKVFAEKHQVYAGFDYSISQRKNHFYEFTVEGFSDEKLDFLSNALQYEKNGVPKGTEELSRRIGFTGNVNYIYDNRYFADFSYRVDGSSLFGTKNKFAPFWSAGIGWNVHNESFLRDHRVVNTLRLRGSYGETGSQQFSSYQALSTFNYYTGKRYIIWNGAELMGLGNEKLKWQVTKQINGGVEVGLFDNRVSASFDMYNKKTSNLLSQMDLPLANGFSSYVDNVGEVKNVGYEVMLSGYLMRNTQQEIMWSVTTKLAYNKDEITKLSAAIKRQTELYKAQDVDVNQLLYEGYSKNSIWAVPSLGIDPSTGAEIFLDKNGNITEKWNPSDKRYFGVSEPKYRGNLSSLFSWKDLSVNLSFAFQWGGQQYNETLLSKVEVTDATINKNNVDKRVYKNRWQKAGDIKEFKGYGSSKTRSSSRFVMDDKVFQFQSASVQYRWHSDYLLKKWSIETINIGANMSDIFYISSIKRERGTSYPFARRVALTLSLMF